MSPPQYQQTDAEFDADMAYLQGLSDVLFEFAPPEALMRVAAFDRERFARTVDQDRQ